MPDDLNQRREAARQAMEGRERRARRIAIEREAAEKKRVADAVKADLDKRRTELEQKRQAELAARAAKLSAQQKTTQERQDLAQTSQTTAENLRQTSAVGLSPLRTLKTDTARLVEAQKVSLAQIAIRESERNRVVGNMAVPEKSGGRWLVSILIGLIILILIGGGGWWWFNRSTGSTVTPALTLTPLLPVELNRGFDLTAATATPTVMAELKNELAKPATGSGKLTYFYFTETATSTIKTLPLNILFERLGFSVDAGLIQSVKPDFMLLSYDGPSERSVVWILRPRSFDSLAAAWLARGNQLAGQLFGPLISSQRLGLITARAFSDQIIKNQDVRVITDDTGQIILIYGFLNKDFLVVAEDLAAFSKILDLYRLPR